MKDSTDLSELKKKKLMLVLAFALIFTAMNSTMFNIALPSISKQFALTTSKATWIITSYMIIYAIGSVVYGKLADEYKLKDLLTAGLIFFALGSVVGFFAMNYWLIIVGRVLQAMGAAVLPASAMIVPTRYFSAETRGRALGTTSAGLTFGIAVGPIVSGFVTTFFNWHFLFAIPLLTVLTIPFFRKYLDDKVGIRSKTDFIGAFLLAVTIASLLLAISNTNVFCAILGIITLVLFVWRINVSSHPFIQASLFKNKGYTVALFIFALASGVAFALPYLSPLLLVEVNHLPAFTSGIFMFPSALVAALLARTGGTIADKKGNSFLGFLAICSYFLCFIILSFITGASPYLFMVFLILGCVGQTFFQLAMANTISHSLPKQQTGIGMGLFMLVNFTASAISTTLMGAALSNNTRFHLNPFQLKTEGIKYSNIYVILAIVMVIIALIYSIALKSKIFNTEDEENNLDEREEKVI